MARHYPQPERLKKLLSKQAERIAVNRTVAGVHFPIDTWAGAAIGELVGEIVLAMAGQGAGVRQRRYDAMNTDFFAKWFLDEAEAQTRGLVRDPAAVAVADPESPVVSWLWKQAVAEFALA